MNKRVFELIMAKYYGIKEVPGKESNQTILNIIKWAIPKADDDSTYAWCAIFLSYVFNEVHGRHTRQFREPIKLARRFDKVGIKVTEPELGDIVIYWRSSVNSWQGHVGIFIRKEGNLIYTLGGNQSNQVNITPYNDYRLIEYRRYVDPIEPF